jgi:membrane-associated phospholipid phosphatase
MLIRLANFFSYLFHPVFFTLAGILFIFNTGLYITIIPVEFKKFIYYIIILSTVLIPLALLPVLYLYKSIQNITLNERRERIIPLLFTTICFYIGYYMVSRYASIRIIDVFLLACVSVLIIILIVSLFWKISLHMAGLGGLTGLVFMISCIYRLDMTILLSAALLISGIVASSRLVLNAHNTIQLMAGYVTGLGVVCLFMAQLVP